MAWLGEVLISQPPSLVAMALVVAALATALVAAAGVTQYSRKASATGYVSTSLGLAKINSQVTGSIQSVRVSEGQRVSAGQVVAVVDLETTTAAGKLQAMSGDLITQRRRALEAQHHTARSALTQDRLALERKGESIREEIETLDRQIALQSARLRITEGALERFRKVQQQGFISEISVQEKEKDRLADLASIESLSRTRVNLARDLGSTTADIAALQTRGRQEQLKAESDDAQLMAEQLQSEARRQTLVPAPVSGVIAGVTVTPGMSTQPGQVLMTIIPEGAAIQIDAYVQSRSVGFIKVGSPAKLQYQSFPHQKFGTHDGIVTQVSEAAVSNTELPFPASAGDLYYVVSIRPAATTLDIGSRKEPLRPGMKVDVRVVMERRSILEWVFDPIIGLQARV